MDINNIISQLQQSRDDFIGCYITEHGTRHDDWYSPVTGKTFEVPRHPSKELAAGTAHSIMKDAGLK